MSKTVEFYYDYGSPASYLAWTQLPDRCRRLGATLVHKPILIGGLFKITGNVSPVTVPPKGAWFFDDAARHAAHYGVAFRKNPYFIINSLPLMRGAMWAAREQCIEQFDRIMFEACWINERNLNDPEVIEAVIKDGGLDADVVAAAIQTDEIKQALIRATQDAADRGLFGVPTMVVGDEMHFGQDRLDWVERALAA
jgi:2-hydroxychromene-2-carboxylate isomerase